MQTVSLDEKLFWGILTKAIPQKSPCYSFYRCPIWLFLCDTCQLRTACNMVEEAVHILSHSTHKVSV